MKIALVILHADSARGGAERYTLDLAASLVARGHEVSILASQFQTEQTAGRRVILAAGGMTRTAKYLAFLDSLDRELAANKYDIIHAMLPVRQCDVYHPHAGIAAETMAAGHRTKSTRTGRALAWAGNRLSGRRKMFARIERQLLTRNNPPVVLCLSRLIASVVQQYYPSLPEQNRVALFNGTDLQRFDPVESPADRQSVREQFKIGPGKVVALMIAQDFERKGLTTAIGALARLADPNVVLLVAGRPDPTRYHALAKHLGIDPQVIFSGPVSKPQRFYRASDFFILPTNFDPCSLVVLEALAMGLPVISTTSNGACEVMTDHVHGRILQDPQDASAFAAAIKELIDPATRSSMSMACLGLRSTLSQESHLDRLETTYRMLCK